MTPHDAPRFFELLDLTYDMIGVGPAKVISPAAKAMFFQDLGRYPLELLEASLAAHRQDPERGKFTPKPADIIFQIERRRKVNWLSADEAWSQVPKIEGMAGLLNDVSAQALAVATPLLNAGDETAARMAFKGAYNRLVELAKLERRGPQYWVSPGGSFEEQEAIRAEGVRQGLLAAPKPEAEAPRLSHTPSSAKPDLKALLLTLKPKHMIPMTKEDYEP
jgi:hypothetical protein